MSMKAIIAPAPGGPEVLTLAPRPIPVPGAAEVLIRTLAAGVNRPDIMQRSGALPAPPGVSDILGLEVSGIVEALGPGAPASLLGAPVMALVAAGGYAPYVAAPAALCLPVPAGLPLPEAAALPEGLFTLQHNLFERGGLQPGERLLIEGGASGIGTLAIQLARAIGAEVIVTAGGPEKCAKAEALGARAIDYRACPDLAAEVLRLTGGEGVDVVIDILGGEAVNRHLACMAYGGRHIGLSFMQGMLAPVDLGLVMRKGLWLSSSTLRPRSLAQKTAMAEGLRERLLPLLEAGGVRPVVSATWPLAEAAAAHRHLESGANFGKIILTTEDPAS